MLVVRFQGVEEVFRTLGDNLDYELHLAMEEVGIMVATRAREAHGFKNRTGELERSIRHEVLSPGRFLSSSYQSVVAIGDTRYGEYMEWGYQGRFAYLVPAFESRKMAMTMRLEMAFERAAEKSPSFAGL